MEKILIIKTSALGDIIHAYPTVEFLRKKFPKAQIDWVVEAQNAELVRAHPAVNRTLTIYTKEWRKAPICKSSLKGILDFRRSLKEELYDVAFDLQGNIKSGLILSQVRSKHKVGFSSKTVPEWPNLLFTNYRINPPSGGNIRSDYLALAEAYIEEKPSCESLPTLLKLSPDDERQLNKYAKNLLVGKQPKVMVCSGSAWPNKQLTTEVLTDFLALVQKEIGCTFLFAWGSPAERLVADELKTRFDETSHVMDRLRLPMLQNLMAKCDLVIAMDSLPLHLAGTTKTPTYSVFGASSAAKYKPLGSQHAAFQGSCPYGRTFEKRCPILRTCPTGACIRSLQANAIFSDFCQFINEIKSHPEKGDGN